MKNNKALITLLIVAVILFSGFAFIPLYVFAHEESFSWQNYMNAYIQPLLNYLPFIIR